MSSAYGRFASNLLLFFEVDCKLGSWSDQEKQWLQEAANEAVPVQREYWAESEAEALAAVKAAGVEVTQLTEEEKAAFSDQVSVMYEDYKQDTLVYNLIQQIQAVE